MSWGRYIVRRLVSALGVLLAVVVLTFWLSRYSSYDPVYTFLASTEDLEKPGTSEDRAAYKRAAHTLGLDLPTFFWGLQPSHYPDTLHRLQPLVRRHQAEALLKHGLEWSVIEQFQKTIWEKNTPNEV